MQPAIDRGVRAFCPDCGANVRNEVNRCWLCFRKLPPIDDGPPREGESILPTQSVFPAASTVPKVAASAGRQFSLATILLIVTLIAVCLGVYRIAPVVGLVLGGMAIPALIATIAAGAEKSRRGHQPTIGEKIGTFLALFSVIVLASLAGLVALLTACGGLGVAAGAPTSLPGWQVALLLLAGVGIVSLAAAMIHLLGQFVRPPRLR